MDRLVIRENMYIMRAGHIMYNLTLTFHGFVSVQNVHMAKSSPASRESCGVL